VEEAAIAAAVVAADADTKKLQTKKTQVPSLRLFRFAAMLKPTQTLLAACVG